ncbi:hypothetical protein TBLA_0E02210 [Henningerozyma blattae CBS 6284]|uniref:Pre-mRNA-processing protein 45 n=1 Tax=Henningerozyma blattae (strain ATCC 34711 / CBS 6284 / DSM 70876 / NBRC 10599 / NRRL Y-10934 / UCD 77-7) TaxID=1071380 RepID=I2H4H2_HENB6|nr:hypothetical protein TBLA_0E02210 [Tetrapisispora blattae CBS 6284]CCH61274.1 hypothetical protein TBLA_0E02210 [Tetrapisispora blattae CBS 6284]
MSFTSRLPSPKNTKTNKSTYRIRQQLINKFKANVLSQDFDEKSRILDSQVSEHIKFNDFVPLRQKNFNLEIPLPTEDEINDTYNRTKLKLEELLSNLNTVNASMPKNSLKANRNSYDVEYKSKNLGSDASESRNIRIIEHASDPLQPNMIKQKKNQLLQTDESDIPILHKTGESDRLLLSKEEKAAWNIPSAISNWKNPNGFAIDLDKRLVSDKKNDPQGIKSLEISSKFEDISNALEEADKKARETLKMKAMAKKLKLEKEEMEREEKLKQLAVKVHEERRQYHRIRNTDLSYRHREDNRRIKKDRYERKVKNSEQGVLHSFRTLSETDGRDISQKVTLGATKATETPEVQYDSRLYSQGAKSNARIHEDQTYQSPLFAQQNIDSIYRPNLIKFNNELSEGGWKDTKIGRPIEFTDADSEKESPN